MLSRIALAMSAGLLVVLVALRITAPEQVVNQTAGFVLSVAWAQMLFFGLAEWKGLNLGSGSAGKPITIISGFLVAGVTDYLLGLGFLSKSEINLIVVLFLVFVLVIVFFAWWKILWKNEKT